VAEHAELALLDEGLASALGPWPTVASAIVARSVRRARGLSLQRSFAQLRRMDERTLLWLWHVAERFGRVTQAGIAVRLPLTHERLAALVGAHRPSLTSALIGLEQSGLIIRDEDHHYVLTAAAAEAVDALTGRAAPVAA
jgi:CRP-like cAMP-binding protein